MDVVQSNHTPKGKSNVIFCLPEGLTLGGVTTWSVELSRELQGVGFSTMLGVHPSRYNNPPVDFGITKENHLIDCTHLLHPDDPALDPDDYIPYYGKALPGLLIPNWSWGAYAMAARLASQRPEDMRIIGMAHADESGYYQWLVHYEAMIHKFFVMNSEIQRKLSLMIPHRSSDILVRPCQVSVSAQLDRTYSASGQPLQLVYGGRIANYQKRIFDLLDLFKALVAENVDFYFRIIGGGVDKVEFDAKVNRLPKGVRSRISLEDSVSSAQISEIWRSTDINIIVSEFEGVSNSMLKGMAEGCVPVMTEVSGTSEVISSGENGYLVPVGDMERMAKIIKILDQDRSLLVRLGMDAHKKIKENYSMAGYVPWFIDVVNKIWEMPARPWPPAKSPVAFETIDKEFVRLNDIYTHQPKQMSSEEKKKILFISHLANWGGAQKVLYILIKGLDKNKWTAIVALPEHGELEEKYSAIGIKTIITPMKYITAHKDNFQQYRDFSNNLRERVDKAAEILDREQVNLVVTNTICCFEGALAAKLKGVPHIWYVHELSSQDDLLTPVLDYRTFYASLDSLSDKLVVVSKAVQNEISQFFPSKKLKLIYTGLEDSQPEQQADRKKILGIDPKIPVITFLGLISERKGVLDLVDTAIIVARRFSNVKFVIAGKKEGETYVRLQKSIKEKQIEDNFKFLGFRNDTQDVIACSDIIIIPSLAEPCSLVAFEAMQAGRPVVATRSGGQEETLLNAETGILVPVKSPYDMAQAIIRLLEEPELMEIMGQKGRRRFKDVFNYAGYISQFDDVLEEVSSQKGLKTLKAQSMVEDIIKLITIAAYSKERLAGLNRPEDPAKVVEELLDYPGYIPYNIMPRNNTQEAHRISVCVPVFNGSEYIRDCINSILSQSFPDFELILVNDASTDDSRQIIRSYQDPRIKYYENDRNLGLVGNWNKCLEYANGEYICIFHQDDIMLPENLAKKVAILDTEKQVGMVYSDTFVINKEGKKTADHWFNPIDPNVDFVRPGQSFFDLMFVNLNIVSAPSVLARRECYENIGGFDARLPFSVDMEMWMRIALFFDVAYLAQPLIQYRFHDSNVTHRFLALDLCHIYICKKMLLEKYPERLDNSYHETLVDDSTSRIFERAIHHFWQQEYKTAKLYLVFLKKIRDLPDMPGLIDEEIEQLLRYVNQENAITLLGFSKKGNFPTEIGITKDSQIQSNRSSSGLVTAIKPYIPPTIKKPLKLLRVKFISRRKT